MSIESASRAAFPQTPLPPRRPFPQPAIPQATIHEISSACLTNDGTKKQRVRTPFLPNWDQVPLERLNRQSELGLMLEGSGRSKTIALTFDDGPSRYTREILQILARNQVKATFFMLGRSVRKMPQRARLIAKRGHCVGNHTYNHQRADRFSDSRLLINQVHKTELVFRRHLNCGSNLYRPAYGAIRDTQITKLNRIGYHCFGWSIDTQDWFFDSPEKVYRAVANNLHDEAVILMHDRTVNTVMALQRIIDECRRQDYRFVTLDKYVPAGKRRKAHTLQSRWMRKQGRASNIKAR